MGGRKNLFNSFPLIEAVQHTISVTALMCAFMVVETVQNSTGSMKHRLKRISFWANKCSEHTKKRRVSSGAERAFNRVTKELSKNWFEDEWTTAQQEKHWASLVWLALTLLEEVKETCPAYWDGPYKKAWRYLYKNIYVLWQTGRCKYSQAWMKQGQKFI